MRKRQLATLPLNDSTYWIVCHAMADPKSRSPQSNLEQCSHGPGVLCNAAVLACKGSRRSKVIL